MRFSDMLMFASLGVSPLSVSIDARQALLVDDAEAEPTISMSRSSCETTKKQLDDYIRKDKYIIGIQPKHDKENYIYKSELIFQEFLTATAGQKFDPPITFELIPASFEQIISSIETQEVDFFFANAGLYSCVGIEVGAIALNTVSNTLMTQNATG